jgi:hypothetical protein
MYKLISDKIVISFVQVEHTYLKKLYFNYLFENYFIELQH